MPTPAKNDYYRIGGMQVDVNPFEQQDSDCNLLLNFYSKKYLAKKVRFGYARFLDNPDGQPVRNLIYYQFPNQTGMLRVSGGHTYLTTSQTGSWGSPLSGLDWTSDVELGTAQLAGQKEYVHLSNGIDGYKTWDGTSARSWTGGFTPKANFLAAYQSRIMADVNQLSIAESNVGFDFLNPPVSYVGTGTVAATNGSAAVVGTGTIFLSEESVEPGVTLLIGGDSYVVLSVTDDLNLTLTTPYAGTTVSGISFEYQYSLVDPFYYDPNSANPAQGGLDPLDPGNNGSIVALSVVQNTLLIYKQRGIYRFDGTNFLLLNFANSVVPRTICTSDYTRTNYFLSYDGIYQCDAQSVTPASFGINTIIQDTYTNIGVPAPHSFCFDYLVFFWFGDIWLNGKVLHDCMFVKDERFGEWYIWQPGHTVTCFGSYSDSDNVRHMVTGDSLGNTWVWGEQYSSDNGTAISYQLRTGYKNNDLPSGTKVPQPQITISSDPTGEAKVSIAKNFTDLYLPVGTSIGFFTKFQNISALYPSYKNFSIEVLGSTVNNRPEIYGFTQYFDEEERFSDTTTNRSERK